MAASALPYPMTGPLLNQTMIRVKDPAKSVEYYKKYFNMALIHRSDHSDFSLYFMATLPEGDVAPEPGTEESAKYLHSGRYGTTLELTHNHGTESKPDFSYHNGNKDPRGFGHIGFLVDDVYAHCEFLEKEGVKFQKKPDDGNMKGLAFALDPDGYWVEIIKRGPISPIRGRPTFQQTMLRVREIKQSVEYYKQHFNMTVVNVLDFPQWKFSLTFLATVTEEEKKKIPPPGTDEALQYLWSVPYATLELTYNYGTDTDPSFEGYNNGNKEPHRGFGHIAFMVDDVYETCDKMEKAGVKFQKKPDDGKMKGLAFALDPDGYWIEIVRRHGRIEKC